MAPNETQKDTDPHPGGPARFIGRTVTFTHGNPPRRVSGIVEASCYVGRTQRGAIPDYQITIRGRSGKTLTISLVESHATFPE